MFSLPVNSVYTVLLYTPSLWFVSLPLKMVLPVAVSFCLFDCLSVCLPLYSAQCLVHVCMFHLVFIYVCLLVVLSVCLSVIIWLRLLSSTYVVLLDYNTHASSSDISIKMKYCDISLAHMWHMMISLFMSFVLINRVVLARFGDTAWQAGHIFKHWIWF